jgi:hypothetical protein
LSTFSIPGLLLLDPILLGLALGSILQAHKDDQGITGLVEDLLIEDLLVKDARRVVAAQHDDFLQAQ